MSDTDQTTVTGTFVRPCLTCGGTVRVVDAAEQPHDCQTPSSGAELIARAWWAGYDAANERRRLDLGAIRDLTVADRPYDWRLAQIDEIAREGCGAFPVTAPVPAGIVEAAERAVDSIFKSGKHCPHQGEEDPISAYDCPRCVGDAVLAVVLPMVADEIEALRIEPLGSEYLAGGNHALRDAAKLVRSLAEGLGE